MVTQYVYMVIQYVYMVIQYVYNWYTSALLQDTRPSTSDTPGCPTVEHQASPSEIFTVGNVIKVTAVLICCCCHYYNTPLFPY